MIDELQFFNQNLHIIIFCNYCAKSFMIIFNMNFLLYFNLKYKRLTTKLKRFFK